MKRFLVVLFILSIATLFGCSGNKEAQRYYKKAQEVLDDTFLDGLSDSEIDDVELYLGKSIEADPSWWKPYWQRNQLYKLEPNQDFNKINNTYELWLSNGNVLTPSQKFSYACTKYVLGNHNLSIDLFNEIYKDNVKKLQTKNFEQEVDYVATVFSGILTDNIIVENANIVVLLNDGNRYVLETSDELALLFLDYIDNKNRNISEAIQCYAGSF